MQRSTAHFDRRGATYDQNEVHHRIVSLLISGGGIRPGFRVLDIATGTGLLALEAARQVGPTGKVLGIDLSKGMLDEADKKAITAGLQNINFQVADAERLELPRASFDCVFCASALVLMPNIPRALNYWSEFLKPGGMLAFDTPSKPFGISQMVADIAAAHGVQLNYADIADTPDKCRSFLAEAGYEILTIRTERINSDPIELGQAIAFWDSHLDHPAWQALNEAQSTTRDAIRSEYVQKITAAAIEGCVPNYMDLNFSFGRRCCTL